MNPCAFPRPNRGRKAPGTRTATPSSGVREARYATPSGGAGKGNEAWSSWPQTGSSRPFAEGQRSSSSRFLPIWRSADHGGPFFAITSARLGGRVRSVRALYRTHDAGCIRIARGFDRTGCSTSDAGVGRYCTVRALHRTHDGRCVRIAGELDRTGCSTSDTGVGRYGPPRR